MSLTEALKQVSSREIDRVVDGYAARLIARFGRDGFEAVLESVLQDRRITKVQLTTIARLMDLEVVSRAPKRALAQQILDCHLAAVVSRDGAQAAEVDRLAA
ncbi:MAG: hypothetical protein AAGC70_15360 [Pseudomonadota bacterium]